MNSRKTASISFNSITPFCQDKKSLYVRIAILSTQIISFSDQIGATLLFLESLQLMSQIILLNSHFQPTTDINPSNVLYKAILLIAKVLTPSQLIIFEGVTVNTCITLMSILTLIFLLKVILFIYIVVLATLNSREKPMWLKVWAFIAKSHNKVGYYLWSSFWTRIIYLFSNNKVSGAEDSIITTWCVIVIILEFLLAVLFQLVSSYYLPTKDFLSTKGSQTEIAILLQKVILQILEFSPIPHNNALRWILACLNTLFCLARDFLFFRTFPYYKTKALFYQLRLSLATTCLSFAYLVFRFLRSVHYDNSGIDVTFVMITWGILTYLATKLGLSYLDSVLYNLVTTSHNKYSPDILLHKIMFVREFLKSGPQDSQSGLEYGWSSIQKECCIKNLRQALNLKEDYPINLETDLQLKQSVRQLATLYLEELSRKFPNNNLVKLFLAYYYGKRQKLYGLSMTILVNLRHNSPSIITELNISLLIQKMQFKLIAEQQAEDVALDIYTYIKSLSAVDSLKGSMLDQAQLQIDLCDEILQSTPNLRNILVFSQKISRQRSIIEKKTKYFLKHVPEYYVEPLKFIAHYQLILNHSSELFEQYSKEYDAKNRKYEQFFAKDGLCPENLYEKKNLIMVISGRKENLTTVVHRNSPTFEVYGRDILGDKCYTVGHPALQKFFQQSFQNSLERGDGTISRQILRAYQYNNHKGWAGPCDFYIEISPFLSQDLYYFAVLRMFKNYEEFIILNEDGTIDCCSKKIGYELGCLPLPANATKNSTHISQISKELDQVNHAFNMTAFPEKYKAINDNKKEQKKDDSCDVSSDFSRFSHPFRSGTYNTRIGTYHSTNLSTTQAQELFSLYSTEGHGVRLRSIKRPEKSYFYNCKVQNQLFDTVLIKMMILEKSNEYEDNLSETTDSGPLKSEQPEVKRNNEDKSGQIVGLKSEDLNVEEDDQVSEDEKRDGWINFERLASLNSPLEPKSPDKLLPSYRDTPSSTRNLLTTQNRFTSELRMDSRPLPSARDPEAPKVTGKKEHLIEDPERNRLANNIMESTKSAKVSKAFNDTLKIKYYTRFYRTFLLLWYAVLTALLANQIRLSVVNTSKIKSLQVNKNILRTSSTRTNYLMSVHLNLRSLWTIVYTDPTHSFDTSDLLYYLDILLGYLKDANQELLLAAGNVTQETRNNWFQNDIAISENSQSDYTHLNNFQAIDRIIVSGNRGVATARVNIVDSLPDVNFVLRNSLNDLLIKTNEISDNILSIIVEEAKLSLNHLDINLWITVSFLMIMAIYFVIMVYVQFKNETANLLAFTKLSKKAVENVMERFILFKSVIEEDQDFDEIQKKRHVTNYTRSISHHKGRINTREFQSQGYKGVSRKFFLYGLETIFLLTVITAIIGISHMMSSNNIENNKKHFIQLHYADDMNQIVSLALTTLFEIKANPNATNTTYVQNIPIISDMTYQLQELSSLITETPSQFPQGDLAGDPVLEEIIYEDSCKYIEEGYFKYLCQSLQTGGSSNGVIQVLSDLNLYISDSLAQPTFTSFADQLATINKNLASGAIFTSLSDVINNNFDKSLAKNIAASRLINGAIITSLIVVCIVVHIFVLRGLGESDNTFKKVLQNFPASVILSNFMLKSFLLKTSKGILTSMRNEI